jgi:autotransporter translocation and assembly factor TamB
VQVRGARANPEVAAAFTMRDARLRRVDMASVPAASLTGKATLRDRALSAEARLAAGASTLAIAATGQLPRQGAPGGRLTVNGPVDLAMFASLLGPDIQQVAGRAQVDVALAVSGGRPAGSGTVRLEGVRLAVPAEGLVLSQGSGLIRLAEDRIIIERFAFPGVGKGDVALSGEVRLDPKFALPMDLRLETRRARLLARRDLIAELTSSLRLHGSAGEGLTADG